MLMPSRVKKMPNILKEKNMKKLMSDNIGIILSFIALSYYDSIIPLLNVIGKMQTILY